MNKRSFIKSLLLAAVAPSVLMPKFADAHKWKREKVLWIPNPEYQLAEREIRWIYNSRWFSVATNAPEPYSVITWEGHIPGIHVTRIFESGWATAKPC